MYYFINKYNKCVVSIKCRRIFVQELKKLKINIMNFLQIKKKTKLTETKSVKLNSVKTEK